MAENIIVATLKSHIGEITLNRPENLNTFTQALASELTAALLKLDGDPAVRVIILKGAGKAFCAGIDVSDFFDKSTMEYRDWIECMENYPFQERMQVQCHYFDIDITHISINLAYSFNHQFHSFTHSIQEANQATHS